MFQTGRIKTVSPTLTVLLDMSETPAPATLIRGTAYTPVIDDRVFVFFASRKLYIIGGA